MIWEELTKIALIGTERGRLSDEVLESLSKVGIDTEGSPSRVLLEGAALYYTLRQAGFPLKEFRGQLQPAYEAGEDKRQVASSHSSRHLKHLIEGKRKMKAAMATVSFCNFVA